MAYYHDVENKRVYSSKDPMKFPEINKFRFLVLQAEYQSLEEQNDEVKLRWYQEEAAQSVFDCIVQNKIKENEIVHPICAIPTGAGKTLTICETINKFLTRYPASRVLVLSHDSEILLQNFNALENFFDGLDIGLYSAGLASRTVEKITVAGVQSVYKRAEEFFNYDLIVIDECHLMNNEDSGMYRGFIGEIELRRKVFNKNKWNPLTVIGFSATPYRTSQGYLHQGKESIFNKLVYNLCSLKKFNRLVEEGFLTKLISKTTDYTMSAEGIPVSCGDFKSKELAEKFDRDLVSREICKELIRFKKKYKKWLVFTIDISHAEHVRDILREMGIKAEAVHSKMETPKNEVLEKFRAGDYQALINVNQLTTGVDVPDIDLIALMRPTQSAVLFVQSVGRGLRVAEGKDHCLILDFAGNTKRLGPINDIQINSKLKSKDGESHPMIRECPECKVMNHISVRECESCGFVFPRQHKLTTEAWTENPVSSGKQEPKKEYSCQVYRVYYSRHKKNSSPDSLKVEYYLHGFEKPSITEWVCIEHKGWVNEKAKTWMRNRLTTKNGTLPNTVGEFLERFKEFRIPEFINFSKNPNSSFYDFNSYSMVSIENAKNCNVVCENPKISEPPKAKDPVVSGFMDALKKKKEKQFIDFDDDIPF